MSRVPANHPPHQPPLDPDGATPSRRWRPDPVLVTGTVGAVAAVQSVGWEYARMAPSYGFYVEPWSIRGYETVHGWIVVAAGLLALVALPAVARCRGTGASLAIATGIAVATGGIATVAGGGRVEMTAGLPLVGLLAVTVTYVVAGLSAELLPQRPRVRTVRSALVVVLLVVTALVVEGLVGGRALAMPARVAVGAVLALLLGVSVASRPRILAAGRMLVSASLLGVTTVLLSAGAIRSTLVRIQSEHDGISAPYRATQITSGYLIALAGSVLVLGAAVAIWGRAGDTAGRRERSRRRHQATQTAEPGR